MSSRQKSMLIFVVVLVVSVAAGIFVFPPAFRKLGFENELQRPYRFGLDIAGGAQLIYEVDLANVATGDRNSVMNGLRDVIEQRVNLFGVSEPRVVVAQSGESYRLVVELAGVRDVSDAIQEIGLTPLLDFREVQEVEVQSSADTETTSSPSEAKTDVEFIPTALTGRFVKSARLDFDHTTREPLVLLEFNDEGAKAFEDLTGRNVGRPLAIFLDNQLISSPTVQQKISGGQAQITGRFTVDEARELVERFNAGALPAPISLISQQTVDAVLGQEALSGGIVGGIFGTLAVVIFMIVYYGALGIFAAGALVIYIVLTLGIFKFIPVTLTLAGIAGFILSIGMAVDANILIFERTNEEVKKGLSRRIAIEEGFRRAWPSIRDSNVSTIITSLVLYFFTTSIVQGFALTLLIGVLMSMLSAITITKNMLRVFTRE